MRQRLAPDMPLPPLTAAHISSQSDGPSIEHQYHYGGMRPQGAVMGDRGWHGLRALPGMLYPLSHLMFQTDTEIM